MGWTRLPFLFNGLKFFPWDLAVSGGELYTVGRSPNGGIQKWDGTTWKTLGSGIDPAQPIPAGVWAVAANESDQLFLGGDFSYVGTTLSPYIAQANLDGSEKPRLSIRTGWI